MNRALKILTGVGAGIAAAYFLDPKKGADRRAAAIDKFNAFKDDPRGTLSEITDGIRDHAKTVSNEAKGLIGGEMKTDGASGKGDFASNQVSQVTH